MQSQISWRRIVVWFCACWIVMFATGRRRLAAAFLTRSSRVAIQRFSLPTAFERQGVLRPLQLAKAAAKSTYARKQSLVVHGPPEFSVSTKSKRPFKLVIVESPSKCKTISNILQEYVQAEGLDHDYVVTSCMGHIRNIPQQKTSKNQKVAGIDLESGRYEPTYTILPEKVQLVADLQKLVSQSQQLILATDDDREGEAMAWHLLQVLLKEQSAENGSSTDQLPPLRVRFTEITPKAITESIFQHASTSLRDNLVQAQETRRILDRLAGFTVSPILWKKIAPGLSAGRVQSVGMALIVQRERERLIFQETEYWDIQANFTVKADTIPSTLVAINGSPLASGGSDFEPRQSDQLTDNAKHKVHLKENDARDLVERFETEDWTWIIANITQSDRKLNPPAPFITSTLQQEANNRLGLSVSQTMQTAQQLYENGFISYMRTDSNHLSEDAKEAIKIEIVQDYGGLENFQPIATQRSSRKKSKNKPDAQAAHEAIRPAIQSGGRFTKPGTLPSNFDGAANELYKLIYQRTVASHMPPQVTKQTTVRILGESGEDDTEVLFRTAGSVVVKPGYTAVYPKQSQGNSPTLPQLEENQKLDCDDSLPIQHITQPPPRFTEASFVQELEALGVGRPSTYAGTVKILRDRAYVGSPSSSESASRSSKIVSGPAISAQRAAGGAEFIGSARGPMVPSLTAFVVCSLLEKNCNMYVDPSFTAKMEERLDLIANAEETVGDDERIAYLDEFYGGDHGLAAQIQKIDELVDADDARRADLPSLKLDSNGENYADIGLFVGPWGPYVKKVIHGDAGGDEKPLTAQLPPGMASDLSTISLQNLNGLLMMKEQKGSILGQHPEDGRNIRLKIGRFGAFLQWGDDDEEETTTHTLPAHMRTMKNIGTIDEKSPTGFLGLSFEEAVQYVNLPRTVCTMDDSPIIAAIGPYGPYLKYNNTFITLRPADGDVISIDPETAKQVVTEGLSKKSKLGAGVLAEIGEKEGSRIVVKSGRFGMYINWKKVNAKMPADYMEEPSELPLDEAWSLIQAKAESMGTKVGKGGTKESSSSVDLPPGPKRPHSAYLHFCAEKRQAVAEKASSLGETSKELARLWAETSDDDRKPYSDLAEASKREYEVKKAEWTKECQDILAESNKKSLGASAGAAGKKSSSSVAASKKDKDDSSSIKRPRSSYLFFCSSKRPEVAEKFDRLGDISKELGRMWSEITPEEKQEFDDIAAEDKERYEREKAGLEVIVGDEKTKKSRPVIIKRKATTTTKKVPAAPSPAKKRGPSAYMLFCAAHRNGIVDENNKKLPLGQTTKRLAEMWKECDDETRSEFMAQAERQKEEAVAQ